METWLKYDRFIILCECDGDDIPQPRLSKSKIAFIDILIFQDNLSYLQKMTFLFL